MRKLQPLIYALLISAGILIGSFNSPKNTTTKGSKINGILEMIESHYVDTINTINFEDKAINAILSELDPHSSYISINDFKSVEEDMQGSFSGIGVQFNIIDDSIVVVSPISGGPSEKLGIKSGDRIVIVEKDDVASTGIKNDEVIKILIEHKIDIVKSDKFDNNIRLILNFGHTVGHALESYYNYRLPHGKAIIYGMKVASYLSYKDKNLTKVDYSRIDFLIKELSLPKLKISDLNKMEKLIKNDKKNINNQLYYITLNKIGKATIEHNYNKKKIIDALKIL